MAEELAFRFRTAELADASNLRKANKSTMSHPDGQGRSETFRGAIERGELLLLERYEPREKDWTVGGFVDYHLRVDDSLTVRDVGTVGESVHAGIVRHLLDELLRSASPLTATLKVRRDAEAWNAIFQSTPGFELVGPEYRRPHYYNIWEWSRDRARQERGRSGRTPPRR
jgi:hypothetical protein